MRTVLIVIFAVVLTLAGPLSAQTEIVDTIGSLPGIEIETSVDKAEMFVGDLINYQVKITYDTTYQLVPPPLGANLGAFDVKDYEPDVETELDNGRRQSVTTFVLSTFTTGDYVIPALPIIFNLPDSSGKLLLAEPVPIRVVSLLENEGDSLDIKPLKAPHEFPRDYMLYYLWGGGALIAIALVVLIMYLRRRRKQGQPVDTRPAWEKAFEKLAFLKQEYMPSDQVVSSDRFKQYYFELTEICRAFLGEAYNVDVLEMTTEEFTTQFDEIDLPAGLYDGLVTFFHHADLVKFARHLPESARTVSDFDTIHQVVDKVRVELERVQQEQTNIAAVPPPPEPVEEQAS